MSKKVYIICSVRKADDEYKKKLENYAKKLENEGYEVHLPHRDTKQNRSGLEICNQNFDAIFEANEIHIFYNPDSQGTHFDMGMAFVVYNLIQQNVLPDDYFIIKIVENIEYGEGKSFARMLDEWTTINN